MKNILKTIVVLALAALLALPVFASPSHQLTEAQRADAEALLSKAVSRAPEIPNDPVKAENEDSGTSLWFEHSYVKVPAEETTPEVEPIVPKAES